MLRKQLDLGQFMDSVKKLDNFFRFTNLRRKIEEKGEALGAHKEFSTGYLLGDYQCGDNSSKLQVAILEDQVSTPDNGLKILEDILKTSDEKKYSRPFDTRFIHNYFYRDGHSTISAAADGGDLHLFLKHQSIESLRNIDYKECLAQIVLAIAELHLFGLVHRDLKIENFLVFTKPTYSMKRKLLIKLTDLDWIETETKEEMMVCGSSCNIAPEISKGKWELGHFKSNKIDPAKYHKARKKPLDCFALGVIIKDIRSFTMNKKGYDNIFTEKEINQLHHLYEGLTNFDPSKRMTIEQVMESAFFGDNPAKRKSFFNQVKQNFREEEEYFDGFFRQPHQFFSSNDNFLLLPPHHKKIHITAKDLINQMGLIFDMIRGGIIGKGLTKDWQTANIKAVRAKASTLLELTDNSKLEENEILYPQYILKPMNQFAKDVVTFIDEHYLVPVKDVKQQVSSFGMRRR